MHRFTKPCFIVFLSSLFIFGLFTPVWAAKATTKSKIATKKEGTQISLIGKIEKDDNGRYILKAKKVTKAKNIKTGKFINYTLLENQRLEKIISASKDTDKIYQFKCRIYKFQNKNYVMISSHKLYKEKVVKKNKKDKDGKEKEGEKQEGKEKK